MFLSHLGLHGSTWRTSYPHPFQQMVLPSRGLPFPQLLSHIGRAALRRGVGALRVSPLRRYKLPIWVLSNCA